MSHNPSVEAVPFRRIPHQSELYLDYLDLSPRALTFYARPPTIESLVRGARDEVSHLHFPREELVAILRRQNQSYRSGPSTMAYIQALEKPDCVAIVTGQQVGLFTGPLYTVYKAFTAIRIVEELRSRGVQAVPVFWMDSEDHDLAEVTRLWVLGKDSVPQAIDYRPLLFEDYIEDETARPVGAIRFSDSIHKAFESYWELLADSPWAEEIRSRLESAYRPEATFSESFGQLMAQLFQASGLVLFDPLEPETKALVSSVFQKAICDAGKIYEALVERNCALQESGYHTQVHVLENSTVLFVHDDRDRKALTRLHTGFGLKNSEKIYSAEELVRLAKSAPERFSPNVLLRPIIQDHLFPTVAYVGGPSEVAYYAQIQVLYELFGRPMPAIWPRASFTLLEKETQISLQRYGLQFEDCFQGKHHLVEKIISATNHSSTTRILEELQKQLEKSLEDVRPGMLATEASLGPALDTARRKILHQVSVLQTKFVHLEARRNQGILREAEFFLNNCYPNKNLQEREMSVHYFLARHGLSLLDTLYSLIETGSFAHKLVKL